MADAVEREFASVKIKLDNLINDTSRELGNLDKANRELLERTARAVDTLDVRLRAVENIAKAGGGGDNGREGRDSKTRGYLPFKSTIPESLGNEPTKWRAWKMDALGYFDSTTRGMKAYLLDIEKSSEDISEEWAAGRVLSRGVWASADKELL